VLDHGDEVGPAASTVLPSRRKFIYLFIYYIIVHNEDRKLHIRKNTYRHTRKDQKVKRTATYNMNKIPNKRKPETKTT